MLIFTNLVLLPILLSYVGVSLKSASRSVHQDPEHEKHSIFGVILGTLEHFSEKKWAITAISGALILAVVGFIVGRGLQIGDVHPGAPEFRPHSVYNLDNAYVSNHYSLSSDEFAIIVDTGKDDGLDDYQAVVQMDRMEQYMRTVPGVQTTISAADSMRTFTSDSFDEDVKWWTVDRDRLILDAAIGNVFIANPDLITADYRLGPIIVYLKDHKAKTLTAVTDAAEKFAAANDSPNEHFLLAAGTAGMDEATNIVVQRANIYIPFMVYAAVILLCFISFRSWRAVVVAVIPLIITSILCQALMVILGIGVKVATLPVIALGVGIGVDYALYLLSVQLAFQRAGLPLRAAYGRALRFTGRIVALVGFTLAAGVSLWAFSPIKFQAEMGILLTFMFLWNMLGALILVPALSYFLLQTKWVHGGSAEEAKLMTSAVTE